jgi:ribonuclease HI
MIKLLEYLRFTKRLKNKKITVYCDSRLIVNQIANGWRTREPTLQILNRRAKGLYKGIKRNVGIVWVGREEIEEVLGH